MQITLDKGQTEISFGEPKRNLKIEQTETETESRKEEKQQQKRKRKQNKALNSFV